MAIGRISIYLTTFSTLLLIITQLSVSKHHICIYGVLVYGVLYYYFLSDILQDPIMLSMLADPKYIQK